MEGSHLRVASCLMLPAVQLVLGISHPSWVSLPFFIGSCAGVVDWSLTSNFLGLFRLLLSIIHALLSDVFITLSFFWWAAFGFFGGSHLCVWFLRWWRPLQLYAGCNIVLLYVYQLPVNFPNIFLRVADYIGLFKISAGSEWPEICCGVSLVIFYIMVCIGNANIKSFLFKIGWENHFREWK